MLKVITISHLVTSVHFQIFNKDDFINAIYTIGINFMIKATTTISLDHIATKMEFKTIVKVVTVLTLGTLAAAVITKVNELKGITKFSVPPQVSPTTLDPMFSNTKPPVALTHSTKSA